MLILITLVKNIFIKLCERERERKRDCNLKKRSNSMHCGRLVINRISKRDSRINCMNLIPSIFANQDSSHSSFWKACFRNWKYFFLTSRPLFYIDKAAENRMLKWAIVQRLITISHFHVVAAEYGKLVFDAVYHSQRVQIGCNHYETN